MSKRAFLCLSLLLSSLSAHARLQESIQLGLSYDDVLLEPKFSGVTSRKAVSTATRLTPTISLSIPVISANMDTVTEHNMAIAMAQHGGIGIIHRFNTIEQQVEEVAAVKRYRNAIIEHPLTIAPDSTLEDATKLMQQRRITSLLVIDDECHLLGILTSRDIRFNVADNVLVHELMTPKEQLTVGKADTTIEQAKTMMRQHRIEKLPLIHDDWTVAGLITSKDIHKKAEFPHAAVDHKDRLIVGAAIGVKEDALERATALAMAGVDVLVIDIAHGHSQVCFDTLREIKAALPDMPVIAGNVATAQGTVDLIEAGADAIKVGVGPGSICTTRIVSGAGYPQLSAVAACAQAAAPYNIPVIADGGIKQPGDISKALAAGASTVMIGGMLAGTDESPGIPFIKNGKKFKVIRGMASFGAQLGRDAKTNGQKKSYDTVPEGVEAVVPYRGSVGEVLHQLLGGLRSGMSYCGAHTIEQMHENATFVRISSAGRRESNAHDVNVV